MSAIMYLCRSIDVTVLNDSACWYVGMLACRHLAVARTQGLFIEKLLVGLILYLMLILVRSLGRRKVYHCDTGLS